MVKCVTGTILICLGSAMLGGLITNLPKSQIGISVFLVIALIFIGLGATFLKQK